MAPKRRAEVVRLAEDTRKTVDAIRLIIGSANRQGWRPTQYDLVKALFLADRAHLNRWGRPITFDNYVAMKHGPVPSLAYGLLKGDRARMRKAQLADLPWKAIDAGDGKIYFCDASELDAQEVFSKSEEEALCWALATVRQLGFIKVRELTHQDKAYVEAWDDESSKLSFTMSLGLMFDEPDFEAARTLAEYSKYR